MGRAVEGDGLKQYQAYVKKKLAALSPIFARAAVGDFSTTLKLPDDDDEFLELYSGVSIMLEVIQTKLSALNASNAAKAQKVNDLEEAKKALLNVLEDLQREKRKVEESRSKYEALLKGIGDGVIATDAKGKIIFMNPMAEQLLALKQHQFLGKTLMKAITIEDSKGSRIPPEKRPVVHTLTTGSTETITYPQFDFHYVRKDGKRFPVAITVTPIFLDEKIIGTIEVFRDISKEIETDKIKSEFISLAAHQLRTPITTIRWSVEMLMRYLEKSRDSNVSKYVLRIGKSGETMADMVNDFLSTSRLELRKYIFKPKRVNVSALVKRALKAYEPRFKLKKITCVSMLHSKQLYLNLDPHLLSVVLNNLLSNAIKFTPKRGKIAVRAERKKDAMTIAVSDTGYGIPKADYEKIFTKLFRGSNIKDKVVEGTGLGLYLVKLFMDQSGGKVWFQSQENKGTTFFVSFPIVT